MQLRGEVMWHFLFFPLGICVGWVVSVAFELNKSGDGLHYDDLTPYDGPVPSLETYTPAMHAQWDDYVDTLRKRGVV